MTDKIKSAFREKERVAVSGRVMSISSTGDYCNVQFLTKSGETTVAIPVASVRSLRNVREWNFTCEGCGKHSDEAKGWVHDPEDAIWLCKGCKL